MDRPKQLLAMAGKKPMLAETVDRLQGEIPKENIYIITSEMQRTAVLKVVPKIPGDHIIAEPLGRDTAACIGFGAVILSMRDPEGIMVVMPSDHVIRPFGKFHTSLRVAVALIKKSGGFVTFGIKPTYPATSFGYIHRGDAVPSKAPLDIYHARAFREKPNRATAELYMEDREHYWNSGIFVWKVADILAALKEHLPRTYEGLLRIQAALRTEEEDEVVRREFERFESISIDYAVLEKIANMKVVEVDYYWNDIGSWKALEDLYGTDRDENTVLGKHFGVDTRRCTIVGKDRLIATLGVSDLIIVQTQDATLVCDRNRAEDVKKLVQGLGEEGFEAYL
jgi:mannose-1-phosphate guanylyltransferase